MEHDEMYFVINGKALSLDEGGTPIICDVLDDGSIDWYSQDLIEWMDLTPDEYHLYKACIDFIQEHSTHPMYVK
jgi:hypothetical protein